MNLIQQIEDLRRQMHAQRNRSDRLLDAVFRQLHAHAEATRSLEAAFGHLLEQQMRPDERRFAEELHNYSQQYSQKWGNYGPPRQDGGYQS